MKFISKNNVIALWYSNHLRAQVTKGTASLFLIQGVFAGVTFLTVTLLAQMLGPEGFGAYSNAIAWANVFSAFGLMGFGTLIIREVATFKTRNQWAFIRGLFQISDGLVLLFSILLTVVLFSIASLIFSSPEEMNLRLTLWIAAPIVPLWTFANLRQSAMCGLQHVAESMLPDLIIRPILTLALIVGVYSWKPDVITSQTSMALGVCSSIIALTIAMVWVNRLLPNDFRHIKPEYRLQGWLRASFSMYGFGVTQILLVQGPVAILGSIGSARDVAFFSVAWRVGSLLTFLPTALSIVMAPIIARMYAQGEKSDLQKILRRATRLTFTITLFLGGIFIIFGDNILALFGSEYSVAKTALIMLTIGYLVDSGLGLSVNALLMTGHERPVMIYQIVSVVLLLVLCLLLIPSSGFEGVALASMSILILSRILFAIVAYLKTGIQTTVLCR
jgi:O-antigen/teichoic acid export membrane protein